MKLPQPSVQFGKLMRQTMAKDDMPSQVFSFARDGNLTAGITVPLGVVLEDGKITDFLVAVANNGRDDDNSLGLSAELQKNGVSVLSGEVEISDSASGEAGTFAYTEVPTFVTTSVVRGDLLSLDVTVTRTASPTTEIQDLCASVKIVPSTS